MEAVIQKLILKRFRSIPSAVIDFDNPTFLVGKNGSGKSNVVSAFSFLSDAMGSPLQAVFDRRGGITAVRNKTSGKGYPPNMGIAVVLGAVNGTMKEGRYAFEVKALPNYGFEVVREQCWIKDVYDKQVSFERTKKQFKSSVSGLDPSLETASLCLPLVAGDARFSPVFKALAQLRIYAIEPGKLRDLQEPDSGQSLKSDGSNAASVLQELERTSNEAYRRICEILRSIVPATTKVISRKHGKTLSVEFTQEWGNNKKLFFEAFDMSDGTLRALALLLAIFQEPTPSLVAIEEPESSMHPEAIGSVLSMLQAAAKRTQIVVTTHSPEVLGAKWIEDKHLRVVEWNDGATRIGRIPGASREALTEHLAGAGELLRTGELEREPLFADHLDNSLFVNL